MSVAYSWIILLGLGVFCGAAGVGLIFMVRERRHRARVQQLMDRLQELETLGISLVDTASVQAPVELNCAPRGWLSSVVSSLIRKVDVESTKPKRIDLRAVAYISERLDETISIPVMAEVLCASPRTLQRQLAKDLGCSPTDLIVAVKMHSAKRLLHEDGALVQDVARLVGYDDPYHFSRRFRAYYDVPPSQLTD